MTMNNFNEKAFIDTIQNLTMPEQMAETLAKNCINSKHTGNFLFRYSKLAVAAIMVLLLTAVGTTSHAAYQLYQIKNVNVFFDSDITKERLNAIGEELNSMEGVYSVRFVSSDEAWNTFCRNYLTDDLAAQFTENPLADSFSYHVIIELGADDEKIAEQISKLEGVRHVSNLKEQKRQKEQ